MSSSSLLALGLLLLIPCAHASVLLMHQGLGRSRSAGHTAISCLCATATAVLAVILLGSHFIAPGPAAHVLHLGRATFDWLGAGASLGGVVDVPRMLSVTLEALIVSLVATIPVGTGSDRWRLVSVCLCTALLAAFIAPLYLHATWGHGWLQTQLQAIDGGGAGAVDCMGGLAALSVALILGPRAGKYQDRQLNAIPGHNIAQVLLGCLFGLIGWTAMTCAIALLFAGATELQLARIPCNMLLGASGGLLASVLHTTVRYRKPDASISANGWMAGLAAVSAAATSTSPWWAALTGAAAGALLPWLVEMLELQLLMDDPGGCIATYLGGGMVGLLSTAIFAQGLHPYEAGLLATLAVLATLLGLIFPLIHGTNLLLNLWVPLRVDASGDIQGMDVRELGSGTYPEFVVHVQDIFPG